MSMDVKATGNPVMDKSLNFALRIIKLCHFLNEIKREYVLSKELMIAGTNIGRHVKAAIGAEDRGVFISEMAAARRRALETEYWLLLLSHGEIVNDEQFRPIEAERLELVKIISSIVSSSRRER